MKVLRWPKALSPTVHCTNCETSFEAESNYDGPRTIPYCPLCGVLKHVGKNQVRVRPKEAK